MSDTPRENGWYWREDVVTGHPTLCRWVNSTNRLVLAHFAPNAGPLSYGDNELSPVATPAEVAALRAERDAAVDAWKANERRADQCRDTAESLRAEVERLKARLNASNRALLATGGNLFRDCAACSFW